MNHAVAARIAVPLMRPRVAAARMALDGATGGAVERDLSGGDDGIGGGGAEIREAGAADAAGAGIRDVRAGGGLEGRADEARDGTGREADRGGNTGIGASTRGGG